MSKTPKFVKRLEPKRDRSNMPTALFDLGLEEWQRMRGHELHAGNSAGYYDYYQRQLEEVVSFATRWQDETFASETAGNECLNFGAMGTTPARVLETIARDLGWRLVPLVKYRAHALGEPKIAEHAEVICREWCSAADAMWPTLSRVPDKKVDLDEAQAICRTLRRDALHVCKEILEYLDDRRYG